MSVSRLVQILKSMTGRELKLHHPYLNQVAWRKNSLWSSGYFACSVGGAPLEVLKQYVAQQDRPHQAFFEGVTIHPSQQAAGLYVNFGKRRFVPKG
ncbi:transposase [Marinomonas fungiae]|uniref:transposase n=1 Tax=Marinomonas fungiae TaxID=1137284 RepID=UPI0009EB53D8